MEHVLTQTPFDNLPAPRKQEVHGTVRVDGRVRGYVHGYLDGTLHGTIRGEAMLQVDTRQVGMLPPGSRSTNEPRPDAEEGNTDETDTTTD